MTETYLGWKIDWQDRETLLARFPPRYAQVIADHVTFARADRAPPMPEVSAARMVGRADDGEGVEALVVELAGTTERPAGGTYHITWSLAEGREAVESNDVIAARGWEALAEPASVRLQQASWLY